MTLYLFIQWMGMMAWNESKVWSIWFYMPARCIPDHIGAEEELSSFIILLCTSHIGIGCWPSKSAANRFPPWSGRKIFSFAWFMHSLPIFGCEAHTAHTMKSMVELALHSLDILWIVKESFKNCSYMWAMTYGQVEQTSGPESLYPPHIYRVKWRIQPLCTLSLWWTR